MKRILIASAALLATTTVASAQEINFSGLARFGVGYDEGREATGDETIIISRFRLNIDASTETDSGLRFAARVRGEANEAANGSDTGTSSALLFSSPRFQVDFAGFRLRIGNVSGVFDSADVVAPFFDGGLEGTIGAIDAFGFPGDAFDSNGTNGGQGIQALYSFGDFQVAASYSDNLGGVSGAQDFQFGAGYAFSDALNVGFVVGSSETAVLGVATDIDEDYALITVSGSVNQFGYMVFIGDNEANDDAGGSNVAYGFGVDYDLSAVTTVAFTYSDGGAADLPGNSAAYSIYAQHDLGAGSSLRGAIGEDLGGNLIADLGIRFDF